MRGVFVEKTKENLSNNNLNATLIYSKQSDIYSVYFLKFIPVFVSAISQTKAMSYHLNFTTLTSCKTTNYAQKMIVCDKNTGV